ncbi:MAG: ABC transporter permease [Christensenellaceae bacterium]|nr:ABC transporter permease [Christensenellaceae bacterium]
MVKARRPANPLRAKMYRDVKIGWKSFIAIMLICLLSTALFMGFDATWRGMEQNLQAQFGGGNLADIWVGGQISDNSARKIALIDGVESAQQRAATEAETDGLPGDPTIKLLMSDGAPLVNKPVVYEGSVPGKRDQCMLQQRFAEAHHLAVGDVLTVIAGGRKLDLTISGLGILPEFVMLNKSGESYTPAESYGYAFVSPGTLGFLPYSEITLTLKPNANASDVVRMMRNELDEKQTTVILRADKTAVKNSAEQVDKLHALGLVVPLLFFLVAALITWTTMGRLVENQRTQIGSLFALGYGRRTLLMHYAEYGVFIALAGALGGIAVARYGFSPLTLSFLQTIYYMPGAAPSLHIWTMVIAALGLMFITGGAGLLSARNALIEVPANLLRPKPPKKAKRIFLERFPFLWNRLGFSGKMIARNMLRSRVRLFMGLIGTIGCTALMLVGFGLRDTMEHATQNYYTNVLLYGARATLISGAPEGYAKSVANRAGAAGYEEEMVTALDVFLDGDWKAKQVFVLENNQRLIDFRDESGQRIEPPANGVAITRAVADEYGLHHGDTLRLHTNGKNDAETVVTRIIDLEMDQGLYFSREAWRKLDFLPWTPTAVLLKGDAMDLERAGDMDGVIRVQTRAQEHRDSNTLLQTLNMVVLLLIAFSGSLALVVYYNLGQLNYSERIRELAALKVLGFLPGEMKKLVLRENIILTCIGLPFGLAAGYYLQDLVTEVALPSPFQFPQHVEPSSIALIALLTIGFSLVVNWILGRKFRTINMVEALKSVD